MIEIYSAIKEEAYRWRARTAQTLSGLVKIPSYSGREEAVCRHVEAACLELGMDDVHIDGFGNVIARIGSGDKTLAFDAHVDTVGPGDESRWELDPFSGLIVDGKVHGRGAADQKGGVAALLTAAGILKCLRYNGGHTVYFTFTVLEEDCEGLCWNYLIEKERLIPDYVISTEPTGCRIYRGQRGRMEMKASVRGISAHGSAPERGENAVYKAARAALAIEHLNETLTGDEFLGKGSITVSKIEAAGPSLCAIPDTGFLYLDRRLAWGESAETAVKQVIECAGKDLEKIETPDFTRRGWRNLDYYQPSYFPSWKTAENHPLVRAGVTNYASLYGSAPETGRWSFSTNCVAIAGARGIPCIGFGPGDEGQAHVPNEYTRIDDLEISSAFYAALPYTLDA